MVKQYRINEIFYSIQGEGVRTGIPHLFLRFSGCNKSCKFETEGFDCDTEFSKFSFMETKAILQSFLQLSSECKWVLLTGGEPLLSLDEDLCLALKKAGYKLAIETNGTIEPSAKVVNCLDWIACSPKRPYSDLKLKACDELKIVCGAEDVLPKGLAIKANHFLVSPAFRKEELEEKVIKHCIALVKHQPKWRLSLQTHKLIHIL